MAASFLYIIIAAVFQIAWLYNIKLLTKERFKGFKLTTIVKGSGLKTISPIIFYILFGVSNILFLTWAMRSIPASLTYAIWTGIVIAASSVIDSLIEKRKSSPLRLLFILMIGAGIVGLRLSFEINNP